MHLLTYKIEISHLSFSRLTLENSKKIQISQMFDKQTRCLRCNLISNLLTWLHKFVLFCYSSFYFIFIFFYLTLTELRRDAKYYCWFCIKAKRSLYITPLKLCWMLNTSSEAIYMQTVIKISKQVVLFYLTKKGSFAKYLKRRKD